MKSLNIILLAAALVASAASHAAERSFSRTLDLSSGATFELDNVNGSVEIAGWDRNEAQIDARISDDNEELVEQTRIVIDQTGNSVSVGAEAPKTGFIFKREEHPRIDYRIRLPHDVASVVLEMVNGSSDVAGISGELRVDSVNGHTRLRDLRGDLNVNAVNGGLEAQFEQFGAGQKAVLESVNGGVTIALPADASVAVRAQTLNGGIDSAFESGQHERGMVGEDYRLTMGAGDGRVSIDTVNGSIQIEQSGSS